MKEKNYISAKGLKRLLDEQEQLLLVERPAVIKVIQWAASNGDRSENADYHYGKKKLREIDRRLHFLASRIEAAHVVSLQPSNNDSNHNSATVVRFGATIIIECEETSKQVTLVGVDEVDLEKNYYSWKSPLGQALIGKKIADDCIVSTPQGEVSYIIISIKYDQY